MEIWQGAEVPMLKAPDDAKVIAPIGPTLKAQI
jgi:hypothetical protein